MNSLREEKKAWRKGYKRTAGLDEAGRGPLAGPVVAAAVLMLNTKRQILNIGIRDSKKLSPQKREKFYKIITKHPQIGWGIGIVSEKVIDRTNILKATKLAMVKAVRNLNKKLKNTPVKKSRDRGIFCHTDFLILDGNFTLPAEILTRAEISKSIFQKAIVKADEKVFSCSAASVLAKVTRDRIMLRYHKKYPRYRFDKHKGYPTKLHKKLLKKHGPCKIHRKSFSPVAAALK